MFSNTEQITLGLIVAFYFLFLFILSLYMKRNVKTYEDYNVAGRSVSFYPLMLTFVSTGVGGATLLGYMENGYSLGMGEQWIHITMFFVVIILALFLLQPIRRIGEEYKLVTIGDYAAIRYGKKARIPTVISYLLAYCAMTGMQFVALASILNLTLDLNMTIGILLSWILLTAKTYVGGLKVVIWQDVIQGTLLIAGTILLFIVVIKFSGGWSNVSTNAINLNESDMLSVLNITPNQIMIYLLTLAFYQFIRQDVWQRIWAAKDLKVARNAYWISMIIAVSIGAIIIAIGVFSRFGLNLTGFDPTLIYYYVIEDVFPFSIVIIMIIVLLAAVISTADSFMIAGSTSIVNDLIRPHVTNKTQKQLLFYSRISVLIVSIIALVLSLTVSGLVNLMVTGTAMAVSGLLAPIIFGLFSDKPTHFTGVLTMWIGLGSAVIWQLLGHPYGIHPIMIGLPLSIVTIIIATMTTEIKKSQTFHKKTDSY